MAVRRDGRSSRMAATRSRSTGATGPATAASSNRTILVDRTIRSVALDGRFVRPARRPAQPSRRSSSSGPPSSPSPSTVGPRSSGGSGPTPRSSAGTHGWTLGWADVELARTPAPARTRILVHATSWIGTTWYSRTVVVEPTDPVQERPTLPAMTNENARGGRGRGSSCRPTTRPTTSGRSRPRSSLALPHAHMLVVDDGSPDGTGRIADELAATDQRIRVRHRAAKQGLGRAYLDGFGDRPRGGASVVVQMDADFSHDPAALPSLIAPVLDGTADLVIGSRYTPGGGGRRLGPRAAARLARRLALRADRPGPRAARPDRRLQGVARDDPRPRSRSTGSTPAATSSRSR